MSDHTVRIERDEKGTIKKIVIVQDYMNGLFDELLRNNKVLEIARDDYLEHASKFVFGPTGALVDKDTGISLEAYTQELLKTRLHWQPRTFSDDEAAAFANPTLASLAEYRRKHGEARFEFQRQRWGVDLKPDKFGKLKPGTRPADSDDQTTREKFDPRLSSAAREHVSNPFNQIDAATGRLTKAAQEKIASMIRTMPTSAVASIARSAKSPDAPYGRTLTGAPLRE